MMLASSGGGQGRTLPSSTYSQAQQVSSQQANIPHTVALHKQLQGPASMLR
jgi:hypothetical protein